MRCPACGGTTADSETYCSRCGANVSFTVATPDGARLGPYSLSLLQQYVAEGRIGASWLASPDGASWAPLHETVGSVADAPPAAGPAAAPPHPGTPPEPTPAAAPGQSIPEHPVPPQAAAIDASPERRRFPLWLTIAVPLIILLVLGVGYVVVRVAGTALRRHRDALAEAGLESTTPERVTESAEARRAREDAVLEAVSAKGADLRGTAESAAGLLRTLGDPGATYVIGLYEESTPEGQEKASFEAGRATTIEALVSEVGAADREEDGPPVDSGGDAGRATKTYWWGDVGVGVDAEGAIVELGISVSPSSP